MHTLLIIGIDLELGAQIAVAFHRASWATYMVTPTTPEAVLAEMNHLSPSVLVLDLAGELPRNLRLLGSIRYANPSLPVLALASDYDFKLERQALDLGITAIFSRTENPLLILDNAQAVLNNPES